MKKLLSAILAAAVLLTVNVTAYAASKPTPVSVSFSSQEPITVVEHTSGDWLYDFDEEEYYYYNVNDSLYQEGNAITVTYSDNSAVVYTCINYQEYDEFLDDYADYLVFADDDYNMVEFQLVDDQDYSHWEAGNTYTLSLLVGKAACDVEVTVVESPVASMRVITPDGGDVTVKENTHGFVDSFDYEDEEDVGTMYYYNYYEDEIVCALGNQLEVTYKDGSVETYDVEISEVYIPFFDATIEFYSFVDENGDALEIELSSMQEYEFWVTGEEYAITLTYMGAELEIPFTITPGSPWVMQDDVWYYIVDDIAQDGWIKDGGKWYFFDEYCEMQTGWIKDGNNWYFLKANGAMATGWVKDGSNWYYMNKSGVMQKGWQKIGGCWYYFNSGGAMATGWVKSGGKWYYMDSNGKMLANTTRKINGKTYTFNASGVMQ